MRAAEDHTARLPLGVGVVVLILALCAMLLQGCSLWIAQEGRFGPDPDWKFTRRPDPPAFATRQDFVTRQDVERMLGSPAGTERIADGQLRAVYEYTVREGRWPRDVAGNYKLMMYADLITLFATELIFIPLTYFNKDKRTYEKEFVYDASETVVQAFPERLKPDDADRR